MQNKLMVSTSGIRGIVGAGLDSVTVARYAAAFGTLLKVGKIVVGRDTRPSGQPFKMAVISALRSVGIDVIDIGIVPTPTVEIAVPQLGAVGGICITASHNPSEWNALKLFDENGEFIDNKQLAELNELFASGKFSFRKHNELGSLEIDNSWIDRHIDQILELREIDKSAIKRIGLKVVVDAVNGAGSIALPALLEKLGVQVIRLNCDNDGNFVHKPEPVPENLLMLSTAVKKYKADMGMACDPDADRLALVDKDGDPIGEELTLALAVKCILAKKPGDVVVNLSTSRVTQDVALSAGVKIRYTPVGEANVIAGMKKYKAVIGGEGNGGVILPKFHYGRDALVGAAIIMSLMAQTRKRLSELIGTLPIYHNIKHKASLPQGYEEKILEIERKALESFEHLKIDRRDGLRFDFERGWFQIRKSNTEPIYRLIIETDSSKLSAILKKEITGILK